MISVRSTNDPAPPKRDRFIVSPRKIRRILRFVQKRKIPVKITYQWNNSMHMDVERVYEGIIDKYEVRVIDPEWDRYVEFKIIIHFIDGTVLEEEIDTNYRFYEFNKNPLKEVQLYFVNSGPYCWFTIERIDN